MNYVIISINYKYCRLVLVIVKRFSMVYYNCELTLQLLSPFWEKAVFKIEISVVCMYIDAFDSI